jgi:hypothetical protein
MPRLTEKVRTMVKATEIVTLTEITKDSLRLKD